MRNTKRFSRILAGLTALLLGWMAAGFPAWAEQENLSAMLVDDIVEEDPKISDLIFSMSLHEKVCQLFFLQPEQFSNLGRVNSPGKKLTRAFSRFPVGGVILFAPNILKNRVSALNAGMQEASLAAVGVGLFIGTDEEGGSVSRLAEKLKLPEKQPDPADCSSPDEAYVSGQVIGSYLSEYGFNLDFAPVADVRTGVPNAEISSRSYSSDPETVSAMAVRFLEGLRESRVIPVLKHFPGHGAVSGNTHTGQGISRRTLEEWREAEFLPFAAGIRAGAGMIMVSHQLAVQVDPDSPASLSAVVIRLLREELGFQGVIITDALRMEAVHGTYGSAEACVRALEAGADMLLLPYNFTNAYEGIMNALKSGRLTEKRIDESLRRILSLKAEYGLIPSLP